MNNIPSVFHQVISQFATISSGTSGNGSFPEPAATFVGVLGVTNLNILGFGESFEYIPQNYH